MKLTIATNILMATALMTPKPAMPTEDNVVRAGMLVSSEWLADHLADADLVLLHVGRRSGYENVHIPGARHLSLRDLLIDNPNGLEHELPPIAQLDSVFELLGVNDGSRIVIYHEKDLGLPSAARAYLTLDYLGMGDRVSLLDGGFPKWLAEERSTSTEVQDIASGDFTPAPDPSLLVNGEWVEEHLRDPAVVVIDARPEELYDGRDKAKKISRYGHIAGAVNIPITEITYEDPSQGFKGPEELDRLFQEVGVKPGSIAVFYCDSGIWASLDYFTAKYLGYEVRFYDGSFQDWITEGNRPIIEPVKKGFFRRLFGK
ncbi:MAG: sulfurtransferase [Fidelibacterota bacterium]|nr:MAG: sulfurtransferase [Candidatus Neomarinimicrobiota bacterium]